MTQDQISGRGWADQAVALIEADQRRSADTHLLKLETGFRGVDLYLKDESTHPPGSLKPPLAPSPFLFGCLGALLPRKLASLISRMRSAMRTSGSRSAAVDSTRVGALR